MSCKVKKFFFFFKILFRSIYFYFSQVTKLDTMPKAGKKVEFSNKVTEQIISDSPREEAENKVVKEVDFDFVITFNERKEEQPKAAPAITEPKVDEAKTGAKSTKKPKEDAKPTGRNKPTKSTSKSPPAKSKSGKGPKATPEASVEEPAAAQEPTLNTDILGSQNSKVFNSLNFTRFKTKSNICLIRSMNFLV
jgi:hypothetical protein